MPSEIPTSAAAGSGRRERKKQDTRDRLVDAAVELFAEQGYAETSIDQIADRADVARATVFNHFARKEDLVLAWVGRRRAAVRESLAAGKATAETPRRLRDAFTAIGQLYDADRKHSRVMVRCFLQCGGPLLAGGFDTAQLFEAVLAQGQARGDIDADLDPKAASRALFDVYLGELYRWAASERAPAGALRTAWLAALELCLLGLTPRPATSNRSSRPPSKSRRRS